MEDSIWRPSVPPAVLPAIHLALCVYIQLSPSEGGWSWFPVFLVDLPFSILLMFVNYIVPSPLIVFGVLGTSWWYLISVGARCIFYPKP